MLNPGPDLGSIKKAPLNDKESKFNARVATIRLYSTKDNAKTHAKLSNTDLLINRDIKYIVINASRTLDIAHAICHCLLDDVITGFNIQSIEPVEEYKTNEDIDSIIIIDNDKYTTLSTTGDNRMNLFFEERSRGV